MFNHPSSPSCVEWVVGFRFSVLSSVPPVVRQWVVGVGFRVCTHTALVVWVVGLFRVYKCVDMNGLRVQGQQLGAAQTETVAHSVECRHFGHATKLHSFKSHNTNEDPRFGARSLRLLAL